MATKDQCDEISLVIRDAHAVDNSPQARASWPIVIQLFCGMVTILAYGICLGNGSALVSSGHGAWAGLLMLLSGMLSIRYNINQVPSFKCVTTLGWMYTLSVVSSVIMCFLAGLDLWDSLYEGMMVIYACSMLVVAGFVHAITTTMVLVKMYKRGTYDKAHYEADLLKAVD